MLDLASFEDVYVCSKMQVERYQELLQEIDNTSDDVVSVFEDALASHQQVLELLQKFFEESFPSVKKMLSGSVSYVQFSAYWDLLHKYPELCKGIEWNIFAIFSEVARGVRCQPVSDAFRKQLPEISALFSCPVMVAYVWEQSNLALNLILAFVQWLSSDLFSVDVEANIGKFYKEILQYAQGKEWTEKQKILVELLQSY